MLVNLNVIRSKLSFMKITQEQAAKEIGISRESFNSKINGKRQFSIKELDRISRLTNSSITIFFEKQCENNAQKR